MISLFKKLKSLYKTWKLKREFKKKIKELRKRDPFIYNNIQYIFILMELANFIVEAVLKQVVTDKIVVYSGRFQPFHKGHKKVYDVLVSKFGSKNVYIATSDVQDGDKSPLSFNDKKENYLRINEAQKNHAPLYSQPYYTNS